MHDLVLRALRLIFAQFKLLKLSFVAAARAFNWTGCSCYAYARARVLT